MRIDLIADVGKGLGAWSPEDAVRATPVARVAAVPALPAAVLQDPRYCRRPQDGMGGYARRRTMGS